MTRLVAVVGGVADAEAAIAGMVDRIVLRPAALRLLSQVGSVAAGRVPVSLWWGRDAEAGTPPGTTQAEALEACGADELWGAAEPPPSGVSAWGVLAPTRAPSPAAGPRVSGVVIDGGAGPQRFLRDMPVAVLELQCRHLRARHLPFGICGAMEPPDVPRLLALGPDRLVVDDVLRRDNLSPNAIVPERVRLVRDLVAEVRVAQEAVRPVPAGPDHIFVRDWTVPLLLGAYGHETEAQRVRFTVEAELGPGSGRAADMRDVVTYDLITDAIARATVTHVALVETIAEDVAALVLTHRRVEAVDITVEKLDLGPGSLGCRIRRRRA